MTYRNETETLREELRRTSAELARANAELTKREPREVEAIKWRGADGDALPWVGATIIGCIIGAFVFAAIGALSENSGHRLLALGSLAMVVACLATLVSVWFKALPRTTVKR